MRVRAAGVVVLFLLFGLTSAHGASEVQLSQTTILDAASVALPNRLRTTVASSGRGYLAAWEGAALLSSETTTIYIRALDADGVPVQPSAVALGQGREPKIAWNGHEYLVVWGITTPTSGPTPTPSVVCVRVDEDGTLIDAQPVTLISEVNPFSTVTTVVWSGSQYLVTWDRGMALVDPSLHAKLVLLPSIGGSPTYSATSDGSFILLSTVYSGHFIGTLYIVPVSPTGELGTPIPLNGPRANVVGVDGGYALIWDDGVNLHFDRLRSDGAMLSTSNVGPGNDGFPRIVTRDGRIVASWEAVTDAAHTRICTARLDTMSQPVCSAISANVQHDPAIATASTSSLVVWSEQVSGRDSVRVAVSPASGVPQAVLGSGRSISDPSPPVPAVEGHGDGTVTAAWSEVNQATAHVEVHLGGMMSKATKLPERGVFSSGLDQTSPAVAAGAGRTAVLWTEGPKIRLTIVDDLSKAVVATLPLATGSAPSVAFDGEEWLVAWQSGPAPGVVRFAVVNSDGDLLSSGVMPATSVVQSAPAVAWSGKVFFATWRESVDASLGLPSFDRIQVATITAAGVPSASLTLDFANAGLSLPSIASNGDRVLVSWGRPVNKLRQALFDSSGKQLGNVIDFAWPYAFTRTPTHAMSSGFATLAGSRIALTSSGGLALETIDVQPVTSTGDFAVDPANRFALIYSHAVGTGSIATFAQTVGLPRRHPQNR
jgi:hypothetical protein